MMRLSQCFALGCEMSSSFYMHIYMFTHFFSVPLTWYQVSQSVKTLSPSPCGYQIWIFLIILISLFIFQNGLYLLILCDNIELGACSAYTVCDSNSHNMMMAVTVLFSSFLEEVPAIQNRGKKCQNSKYVVAALHCSLFRLVSVMTFSFYFVFFCRAHLSNNVDQQCHIALSQGVMWLVRGLSLKPWQRTGQLKEHAPAGAATGQKLLLSSVGCFKMGEW